MIPMEISLSDWLVWALIGLIGGYMAARLLGSGSASKVVSVIVGILGAVGGGWAGLLIFGENDQGQNFSLLASAVVCGILLWLVYIIMKPGAPEE